MPIACQKVTGDQAGAVRFRFEVERPAGQPLGGPLCRSRKIKSGVCEAQHAAFAVTGNQQAAPVVDA